MAGTSKIEWTESTWNPIVGCSIVSPGCTNCYAMRDAWRKHHNSALPHYHGLTKLVKDNPVWTGEVRQAPEHILLKPLKTRKPTVWFVNSMSDLFHESIPDEWIDRVFAVMALCPQHTFQVLTKRAERMREYLDADDRHYAIGAALGNMLDGEWIWSEGGQYRKRIETMISALHGIEYVGEEELPDGSHTLGDEQQINPPWPLPNVWLGVSAERQQEADERIPHLLQTPAAIRFVSLEPLLGPIELLDADPYAFGGLRIRIPKNKNPRPDVGLSPDATLGGIINAVGGSIDKHPDHPGLDWVIVGGESGPKARPMHPDWARSLRDGCEVAGVPFFYKQHGQWLPKRSADGWLLGKDHIVFEEGEPKLYRGWPPGGGTNAPAEFLELVGKKAAGRLLDGREWNQMPEVRP